MRDVLTARRGLFPGWILFAVAPAACGGDTRPTDSDAGTAEPRDARSRPVSAGSADPGTGSPRQDGWTGPGGGDDAELNTGGATANNSDAASGGYATDASPDARDQHCTVESLPLGTYHLEALRGTSVEDESSQTCS